mgnify:CR=1 FL=1
MYSHFILSSQLSIYMLPTDLKLIKNEISKPKREYANPEDSNVYRNVNVNKTYDPGWGRTFVDQIDFYKHLIPIGIGKPLKIEYLQKIIRQHFKSQIFRVHISESHLY